MKSLRGLVWSLTMVSGVVLGWPAGGFGDDATVGAAGDALRPGSPPLPAAVEPPGSAAPALAQAPTTPGAAGAAVRMDDSRLPVAVDTPDNESTEVQTAETAETELRAAEAAAATDPANTIGLLGAAIHPIDLTTALRLAGVQNPDLNVARRRILEAVALRQLAAAQLLPTLNAGMNYDNHTGVLQQSNGNILSINRAAVNVGAGVNAVAAGTVGIPGLVLQGNLAARILTYLGSRQVVEQREFASLEVRNQVFLEVAVAYSELIRAEGMRAIALQNRDESAEIARLTANYAATGEGRQADADRAAAELAIRMADWQEAEGNVLVASARLAQAINIDPSVRLHPTDAWAVPLPIVPDPIPIPQLIAIALLQRPELASRRAAVRAALIALSSAKLLPFSPNYFIGYSADGFGGGSNLVRPFFGGFGGRTDFDVVAYWSIMNMGVGNSALIRQAKANLQVAHFEQIAVLNRTRAEVAENYALTHARYAQIGTTEQAVRAGQGAFERDLARIKQRAGDVRGRVLPIELLNSFRLLAQSRQAYLNAIVDYNNAQFSLYVALGQPPANMLARPVPSEGIGPTPTDTTPTTAAPVNTQPAALAPNLPAQPAPAPPTPPAPNQPGPFTGPAAAVTAPRTGTPRHGVALTPQPAASGPVTPTPRPGTPRHAVALTPQPGASGSVPATPRPGSSRPAAVARNVGSQTSAPDDEVRRVALPR